jgi:hypothetical protein
MRNTYNILLGKPEVKRLLRRPRLRWEHNIRMDLRETVWKGVDWMHLAHDKDQWWGILMMIMNLWVP